RMTVAAVSHQSSGAATNYSVLNGQMNTASVSSIVSGGQIGIFRSPTEGQVATGTGTVRNNQLIAQTYGNAAENRLTIAAASATVTGGVSNVQTNSGAVAATVNNGFIGVVTAAGSAMAGTVSGNAVRAVAVGNSAV